MNLARTLAAIAVSGLAFRAEAYPENCKTTDEREIASLFDGWNAALATGNPTEVAARYTYTYRWNGSRWLISSHHSSAMPEAIQE